MVGLYRKLYAPYRYSAGVSQKTSTKGSTCKGQALLPFAGAAQRWRSFVASEDTLAANSFFGKVTINRGSQPKTAGDGEDLPCGIGRRVAGKVADGFRDLLR